MKPTVQWLEYNFDTFNVKYFEGKLPKPKFSLFCKEGDLGNYTPQADYNTITRKITKLNGPGVLSIAGQYSRSERDIASTLLHEMIHMYIFTVLRINPRFSHGEEYVWQIYRDRVWPLALETGLQDDFGVEVLGAPAALCVAVEGAQELEPGTLVKAVM